MSTGEECAKRRRNQKGASKHSNRYGEGGEGGRGSQRREVRKSRGVIHGGRQRVKEGERDGGEECKGDRACSLLAQEVFSGCGPIRLAPSPGVTNSPLADESRPLFAISISGSHHQKKSRLSFPSIAHTHTRPLSVLSLSLGASIHRSSSLFFFLSPTTFTLCLRVSKNAFAQ